MELSNKYEKRWLSLSKPLYLVLMVISTSSMTIFTELFRQPQKILDLLLLSVISVRPVLPLIVLVDDVGRELRGRRIYL